MLQRNDIKELVFLPVLVVCGFMYKLYGMLVQILRDQLQVIDWQQRQCF
jgi:hypothetical protein